MLFLCLIPVLILSAFGDDDGYESNNYPKPGRHGCKWGSVGVCGGFVNAGCPPGSYCNRNIWPTQTAGLCCRIRPGRNGKPEEKHKWCPSGVIGPACSDENKCKPGYTCGKKTKLCCRDPVCPAGWLEGESCSYTSGQETCQEGYMCMPNNFCCRSLVCPSGSIGPACDSNKQCHPGDKCREGFCCVHPRCPFGWLEGDSVCDLTLGEARCPAGFDCVNDFCCQIPS